MQLRAARSFRAWPGLEFRDQMIALQLGTDLRQQVTSLRREMAFLHEPPQG